MRMCRTSVRFEATPQRQAMATVYKVCGHCCQQLSEKAFKEHEKLYYQDGVWLTESKVDLGCSIDSEPMSVSDPPDPAAEVDLGSDENNALSLADDLAFSDPENGSEKDSHSGMFLTPKY